MCERAMRAQHTSVPVPCVMGQTSTSISFDHYSGSSGYEIFSRGAGALRTIARCQIREATSAKQFRNWAESKRAASVFRNPQLKALLEKFLDRWVRKNYSMRASS